MNMEQSVYQTKDVQLADDDIGTLKNDLDFLPMNTGNGALFIEAMQKADQNDLKKIQSAFLELKYLKEYIVRLLVDPKIQNKDGLKTLNIFLKLIYTFTVPFGRDRAKEDMECVIQFLNNNFSGLKDRKIMYIISYEKSEECEKCHTIEHNQDCAIYYYRLLILPDIKKQECKNKELENESNAEKYNEKLNFVKKQTESLQNDIVDSILIYHIYKKCAQSQLLFIRAIEEADEVLLKRIQKAFLGSEQLRILIVKFLVGPAIMDNGGLGYLNRFLKKVYSFGLSPLLTKNDVESIVDCLNRECTVSLMGNIEYSISHIKDEYWYRLDFDGHVDNSDTVVEQTSSDIDLANSLQSSEASSEQDFFTIEEGFFTIIFSFFYSLWCDLTYPLRWLFG
jgi:DNA-binding MltR family transcriptional regulator